MPNPLEEYLNEVSGRLGPLPVARRNEELREMRQHLQNAVIVNREFGQSETDAVANALAQFGEPQETADSLVGAWRREELLKRRDFWGAAGYTLGLTFAMTFLIAPLVPFSIWPYGRILPGAVSGLVFRRSAVAGTALAAGAWAASRWLVAFIHPSPADLYYPRTLLLFSYLVIYAADALLTILLAFLSSRGRNTWAARVATTAAKAKG